MFNRVVAHFISSLFYFLDSSCRRDLNLKMLSSERDYVSRLMTHINYPMGVFRGMNYWKSLTLPGNCEQKLGCDAIIIFKNKGYVKVGLFEAKWPRLITNPSYKWDSIQKGSKKSHFSSQIERQHKWIKSAAIWEMFFYENPLGERSFPFDEYGASCVWHSVAHNYICSNKSMLTTQWNNNDLLNLLNARPRSYYNRDYGNNFRDIVYRIIHNNSCAPKLKVENNNQFFLLGEEVKRIDVPIPDSKETTKEFVCRQNSDSEKSITDFMIENGLAHYLFIDLDSLVIE